MLPYIMRTKNDCGPAVVSSITEIPYEQILNLWGDFDGNEDDSQLHHQNVLLQLGFKFKSVSWADIMSGKCESEKTAILISQGITAYHWVILKRIVPNEYVVLYFGDKPEAKMVPIEDFKKMCGIASYAYAIEKANTSDIKLPWWKRLWIWITTLF